MSPGATLAPPARRRRSTSPPHPPARRTGVARPSSPYRTDAPRPHRRPAPTRHGSERRLHVLPGGRAPGATPGLTTRRIRLFRLVLVAVFALIAVRLVQVQVTQSGHYRSLARQELTQPVKVTAERGGIYDRNGSVFAESIPTHMVVADDFQISHPVKEALALAPLLQMSAANLAPMLERHSGYVPLVKHLADGPAAKVTARNFPGITLLDTSVRVTPGGNLAAPVVGFVNGQGDGAAGLEYGDNHALAGRSGSETFLESPAGVQLPGSPVVTRTAAQPGVGLETTLDEPLQYTTEQALASAIVSSQASGGTAVVMDVHTGDILASANLVATNTSGSSSTTTSTTTPPPTATVTIGPKGPVDEAPSNLAVTQTYEPGSVFKLVTFTAALQSGVINPSTPFLVPDQIQLDGSTFHDAEPHPTVDLSATEILAQSSNIGTSEIAQSLGSTPSAAENALLNEVQNLGFGHSSGLNFPGESSGLLIGTNQWEPTDFVDLPIGQVDAVTPQQVLDAYNAVANGGVFVGPRLVRGTVSPSGSVQAAPPSGTHRVMSSSTASTLMGMLQQVVSSGTGTSAVVPGYSVAGKTGTSQIPTQGGTGYIPGAYMASFVGIAPANHPVLSAIVVLNHPTPIFGGTVSAPVFSKIMSYALQRYHIPTTPNAPIAPPSSNHTTGTDQQQDIT